ncbi:MAG: tetratricopeptide repeat protein [Acidobacteriia bacterium]|nr:tetratricopeptide repeat protein [Terriglobia bacterium]
MDDPRKLPPDPDGATYVPEAVQTPIPSSAADAPTLVPAGGGAGAAPARALDPSIAPPPTLKPGAVLAGRYEIVQVLGEGGMGAVYKARDNALDRLVALKVIRPELAGNPAILQRFKQELILARQITHRNVIRIYDMGEDLGMKFITMEFVEGQDLHHILKERGKLPPAEAVEIMQQVCRALASAHAENVIHRDLKPQNIMRDTQGRILVMDFGLARTVESSGMTQTGALVGTIEYMSPEQALGKDLDARSDLFSVGLIIYELLTGKMPYKADSAIASLMKRNQERAVPASQVDADVPEGLSAIVSKCLERDPKDRYQKATEILHDLDVWRGGGRVVYKPKPPGVLEGAKHAKPWKWMMISAFGIALAFGMKYAKRITGGGEHSTQEAASGPVVSVAILPFRNASSDGSLDWLGPSLADMLTTDVGQSAQLHLVSQDRLQQIAKDLKIRTDEGVDPATARRLADFSSAETVISGQFVKVGEQIRIDATLRDIKRDRSTTLKAEAPNEKELLAAVGQLAQQIRDTLGSGEAAKSIRGKVFAPSSKSVSAVRYFNEGLQLARQVDNLKARERFEAATKEDPEFALAYSKLAQTLSALGYDSEAETASRKAVDLSDKLDERERYLIQANHARITNDNAKAIQAYENLAQVAPDDLDVQFTLGGLYESTGAFDKAKLHYGRVLAQDPKYVDGLLATGRTEIKSGNPQGSLDYLSKALNLAVQFDNQEEKANILQATGIAYKLMGRPEDALSNYQQSLEIKRKIGQKRGMAASLDQIAQVQNRLGHAREAQQAYEESLRIRREIGDRKGIGDTLIDVAQFYEDRGQHDQALKLYKQSLQAQREVSDEAKQALCLDSIGNVYLAKGEYEDARTNYEQALQIREKLKAPELAETLHNLGETANKMGQFDQALKSYMRALDLQRSAGNTRDAAIESYSLGTVFGYQGRFGAALKAKQEALKTFRDLKDRSPWMAEILAGYGEALAEVGRSSDARGALEESLALSREIQNDAAAAIALDAQGDMAMANGDNRGARSSYEKALQAAVRAKDREHALAAKVRLAHVDIREGRPQAAIAALRSLGPEADTMGLKYLSVRCAVELGEAYLAAKDYAKARQELERATGRAEKLEARALMARSEFGIATALRLQNHAADAALHYRKAVRLLDEIKTDAGPDAIAKDQELNGIYADASKLM